MRACLMAALTIFPALTSLAHAQNQKAGTRFVHVPFRGASQMAIDVAGANVDLAFFMTPTAVLHIDERRALSYRTPREQSTSRWFVVAA